MTIEYVMAPLLLVEDLENDLKLAENELDRIKVRS